MNIEYMIIYSKYGLEKGTKIITLIIDFLVKEFMSCT